MSEVRPEILRYLERVCPLGRLEPIVGDASARRFYRIHTADGTSRVLMDYGKPFKGETDDIRLSRVFREAGLPVARIHDASGPAGCLLLEDLGDRILESELATVSVRSGGPPPVLVRAVELAVEIAERGSPALERSDRSVGPALDAERFRFEMDFFLEHYAADRIDERLAGGLRPELHALAERAAATPRRVLCHRDYHSRNLLVLEGESRPRLAMVDIQDARWGPDTYDLASLLRDAYVDIAEHWIAPLIERYRSALEEPPATEEFRRRFDCVAAQRMIKALGSFGHLTRSGRGERYREAIPRTLGRLGRLLPQDGDNRRLYSLLDEADLLRSP